jgi:hypothetical protein
MSMKNPNDTLGNRTLDLPTCRAVSQPTALPRVPCNTSTTDLILGIRQMFYKKLKYNKAVHQLFIGFKKAYGSQQ